MGAAGYVPASAATTGAMSSMARLVSDLTAEPVEFASADDAPRPHQGVGAGQRLVGAQAKGRHQGLGQRRGFVGHRGQLNPHLQFDVGKAIPGTVGDPGQFGFGRRRRGTRPRLGADATRPHVDVQAHDVGFAPRQREHAAATAAQKQRYVWLLHRAGGAH